jgi:hypothetical protein
MPSNARTATTAATVLILDVVLLWLNEFDVRPFVLVIGGFHDATFRSS